MRKGIQLVDIVGVFFLCLLIIFAFLYLTKGVFRLEVTYALKDAEFEARNGIQILKNCDLLTYFEDLGNGNKTELRGVFNKTKLDAAVTLYNSTILPCLEYPDYAYRVTVCLGDLSNSKNYWQNCWEFGEDLVKYWPDLLTDVTEPITIMVNSTLYPGYIKVTVARDAFREIVWRAEKLWDFGSVGDTEEFEIRTKVCSGNCKIWLNTSQQLCVEYSGFLVHPLYLSVYYYSDVICRYSRAPLDMPSTYNVKKAFNVTLVRNLNNITIIIK